MLPQPLVVYIKVRADLVIWAMIAVTAQNLKVVLVDAERNLIGVSGSVPGARGGLVLIKESRKN